MDEPPPESPQMSKDSKGKEVLRTTVVMNDDAPKSKLWFNGDEGPEEYMLFQSACKGRLRRIPDAKKVDWLLDRLGSGPMALASTAPGFENITLAGPIWDLLNATYGSRNLAKAKDELDQLRQGRSSLEEHIIAFTQLAVEAGVTDETERIRRFKNTVRPDMALTLTISSPASFAAMLQTAREAYPVLEKQYKQRTAGAGEGKATTTKKGGRKERASAAKEEGSVKPEHKDKKCYNCGKLGHIRPNCPSPRRETTKKASGSADNGEESEAEN